MLEHVLTEPWGVVTRPRQCLTWVQWVSLWTRFHGRQWRVLRQVPAPQTGVEPQDKGPPTVCGIKGGKLRVRTLR